MILIIDYEARQTIGGKNSMTFLKYQKNIVRGNMLQCVRRGNEIDRSTWQFSISCISRGSVLDPILLKEEVSPIVGGNHFLRCSQEIRDFPQSAYYAIHESGPYEWQNIYDYLPFHSEAIEAERN